MADFIWIPSWTSATEVAPRAKALQFGDGYEQRTADGLHPTREKWPLVFKNISDADWLAINQFLKDNVGYSFNWTPPGESVPRKFTCPDPWKREYTSYNVNNVSMTFQEVFE